MDTMLVQLKWMITQLTALDTSFQQMVKTTQEMAKSLRKLPAQGALGVGIMARLELFRK